MENRSKLEEANIEVRDILENPFLRAFSVIFFLYLFLVGVKALETSFKLMGSGFADSFLTAVDNPILALFSAMMATVIIQSSSATTSIIVGLVASGTLSLHVAVPMVMGANIGTTVTNTLLSMGYLKDKTNFKKAFGASIIHDFFNLLTTIVLFPFEMATGLLQKTATSMAVLLVGKSSVNAEFSNPLKHAVDPIVNMLKTTSLHLFGDTGTSAGWAMLVIAGVMIVVTLSLIVNVTKKVIEGNQGEVLEKILGHSAFVSVLIGMLLTIAVQSSSVTTSLLVPLAATGLVGLESVYSITVGCNIGTTTTALFASLTGNIHGLTVALVHMLFNIVGTLIWFAPPFTRKIPIFLASFVAEKTYQNRAFAFIYIIGVFFVLPLGLIFIYR